MARPTSITTRAIAPPNIGARDLSPVNVNAGEYAGATLTTIYGQVVYGQVTYGTYQGSAGQKMPEISTREV